MSLPRVRLPRTASVLALLLAGLALGGCQAVESMYPPQAVTEQGQSIRDLYDIVFAIAAIIFVVVEAAILFVVIRYRRKPTDTELPPQIHGNNLVEIIWTVIPMVIVGFLFVISWQTLNTVEATTESDVVRVRAVAARFQWTFDYLSPDGSSVLFTQLAPEMAVPAGKTVRLSLQSPDVIHAFYVPQFLFKRDVVPGKENVFDFKVDESDAGQSFRGQCAELCGAYHGAMQFTVKALTPAEYDTWFQQQLEAAQATPAPNPAGSPQVAEVTIDVSATNIAFDQAAITAPADQPLTIQFQNNDSGVPHNVVIHDGPTINDPTLFDGEIFSGVDSRLYPVPPLPAGTYLFSCKIHPNMTGTLTVQ